MRDRADEYEDDESLVDRSVSFVKQLSTRLRVRASRKWRSAGLNVDLGLLRRRRRRAVLELGYDVLERVERDNLLLAELEDRVGEIREYDSRIKAKQQELEEVEREEWQDDVEYDRGDSGAVAASRDVARDSAFRDMEEPSESPDAESDGNDRLRS